MRISDWSSDVCSSDLLDRVAPGREDSVDEAHDGRVLDKTFNRRRALQQATEAFCPRAVESALAERRGGKTRLEGSIDLLDVIGKASCRERESQYVWVSVFDVPLNNKISRKQDK